MTTVAYINHQGGTILPIVSQIAEQIWHLCIARNIVIQAQHLPGKMNELADAASQMINLQSE